ncbi:helix-turn-helix transcriptional regulator [Candidatus Bathyarchaeota archaeon]|nr:helix-turn-helix transcriptional regulator [Candidatus Bathyarchaeota archaeon]
MTEADEYDEIFAALNHPLRRQILLFLEEHGEAAFTQVQNAVGLKDTGLMSYHLKELAPLVEQSERGKYRLSEVGQAGVELFQRVERERHGTRVTVRSEIEKWLGETIVKSVLLVFLLGFTWSVPATVDIFVSVQSFTGVSLFQLVGIFLVSFFGMVFGVVLFSVYYRHYHSKDAKANIKYTTIFAATITIVSSLVFYQMYLFYAGSLTTSGIPWQFGVLRAVGFMASAPAVAYAISKVRRGR